jgi:hypothetical protein
LTAVSFAIQAHPKRGDLAAELAAKIGGDVDVVMDPDPDSVVKSPWRTFRHLFETTPAGATHRAQIQDDAVICRNYRRAVELAVEARPDRILVFFVGGNPYQHAQAVREACSNDESWAELSYAHWLPVIATCWPVALIPELFEFNDRQTWPERFSSDDERCGRFIRDIKHNPLASVPSLVEHLDEQPSLIGRRALGGRDPGRVAACWIGDCDECGDPLEIDWTIGPG